MNHPALEAVPVIKGRRYFRGDYAKTFMQAVADELAQAGMPRTSKMRGGEITGHTTHFGSTGFSVADAHNRLDDPKFGKLPNGYLRFHVVVSGKAAGLEYRGITPWYDEDGYDDEEDDEAHEPINPDSLHPRIEAVFTKLGLKVIEIRTRGWQTVWDDDVDYDIYTEVV
jgi:hypothetical protein